MARGKQKQSITVRIVSSTRMRDEFGDIVTVGPDGLGGPIITGKLEDLADLVRARRATLLAPHEIESARKSWDASRKSASAKESRAS